MLCAWRAAEYDTARRRAPVAGRSGTASQWENVDDGRTVARASRRSFAINRVDRLDATADSKSARKRLKADSISSFLFAWPAAPKRAGLGWPIHASNATAIGVLLSRPHEFPSRLPQNAEKREGVCSLFAMCRCVLPSRCIASMARLGGTWVHRHSACHTAEFPKNMENRGDSSAVPRAVGEFASARAATSPPSNEALHVRWRRCCVAGDCAENYQNVPAANRYM